MMVQRYLMYYQLISIRKLVLVYSEVMISHLGKQMALALAHGLLLPQRGRRLEHALLLRTESIGGELGKQLAAMLFLFSIRSEAREFLALGAAHFALGGRAVARVRFGVPLGLEDGGHGRLGGGAALVVRGDR